MIEAALNPNLLSPCGVRKASNRRHKGWLLCLRGRNETKRKKAPWQQVLPITLAQRQRPPLVLAAEYVFLCAGWPKVTQKLLKQKIFSSLSNKTGAQGLVIIHGIHCPVPGTSVSLPMSYASHSYCKAKRREKRRKRKMKEEKTSSEIL